MHVYQHFRKLVHLQQYNFFNIHMYNNWYKVNYQGKITYIIYKKFI